MSRVFVTFFKLLFVIFFLLAAGTVVLRICSAQIFQHSSVLTGSGSYETVTNEGISRDMVMLGGRSVGVKLDVEDVLVAVSYTHLTLPTT